MPLPQTEFFTHRFEFTPEVMLSETNPELPLPLLIPQGEPMTWIDEMNWANPDPLTAYSFPEQRGRHSTVKFRGVKLSNAAPR